MALPVKTQLQYWGVAALVFGAILWLLGDILLPFILGGAIAYVLDPLADRLERLGFSRVLATSAIMLSAFLAFLIAVALIFPTLRDQSVALFNSVPTIVENLYQWLETKFPNLLDRLPTVNESLTSLGNTIQSRGADLVNGLVSSVSSIVNILLLIVIVPVVAFYLLMDWDNMVAKIDALVPRDHVKTVREVAGEIDRTLASFIRGQGTVCLILGVYYAIALMLAGLNYGIVVGFIAGLISFIPYVGALVGGGLALGLALFQYWGSISSTGQTERMVDGIAVMETVTIYSTDWVSIAIVGAIFAIGQVAEGNFLTPKLVGNSVGLHPVWLILALTVFGNLFGFVGMLVGVPLAAMLGVVARFMIAQYKAGLLYRGFSGSDGDGPTA